jgi:hypothetical protein
MCQCGGHQFGTHNPVGHSKTILKSADVRKPGRIVENGVRVIGNGGVGISHSGCPRSRTNFQESKPSFAKTLKIISRPTNGKQIEQKETARQTKNKHLFSMGTHWTTF